MPGGHFFLELQKHIKEPRRLCLVRERERERGELGWGVERRGIIYYSNETRSSRWWERGRGLGAENLLLSTSVISIRLWRNKKFKGNQRSWQISLAYFQWAALETEKGVLGGVDGLSRAGTNQCVLSTHDTTSFVHWLLNAQELSPVSAFISDMSRWSWIKVNSNSIKFLAQTLRNLIKKRKKKKKKGKKRNLIKKLKL